MLTLRFDMRASKTAAPKAELYAAAIEMCAWAETRGGIAAVLSEHHATDDDHLPSPLIMASAIAARTQQIAILLAALVLPFCNPIRLAEEMSVLDIISRGRVAYVLAVGHRPEEYEYFGVDFRHRGRIADEKLALLLSLLKGQSATGERGRRRVAPAALTAGGPRIMIGGGSVAAARRAGRYGLGFMAQADAPGLEDAYLAECRAHGHEAGQIQLPRSGGATTVFVADDPDKAWNELGPYLLHDAITAAAYRHGDASISSISRARTVEELRAAKGPYRIYDTREALEELRVNGVLNLHPLCGGLPPPLAWGYLKQAAAVDVQVSRR